MGYQCYVPKNFHGKRLELVQLMDQIVAKYLKDNYVMTVRQLFYQLVSINKITNAEKSYKMITSLVNDARLAGLIDWDGIEDRTRSFKGRSRWEDAVQIVSGCANQFHKDMWENQKARVFVIVEKEALSGVFQRTCYKYDTPMLAARGYPSGTVLRSFVEDFVLPNSHQKIVILHLGDHDPSGKDMSRDLEERITTFIQPEENEIDLQFNRIALTMEQIKEVNPPHNPAKMTDARFKEYRKVYGDYSWELDALSPKYLNDLLTTNIEKYIDQDAWEIKQKEIIQQKEEIKVAAEYIEKGYIGNIIASRLRKEAWKKIN